MTTSLRTRSCTDSQPELPQANGGHRQLRRRLQAYLQHSCLPGRQQGMALPAGCQCCLLIPTVLTSAAALPNTPSVLFPLVFFLLPRSLHYIGSLPLCNALHCVN